MTKITPLTVVSVVVVFMGCMLILIGTNIITLFGIMMVISALMTIAMRD